MNNQMVYPISYLIVGIVLGTCVTVPVQLDLTTIASVFTVFILVLAAVASGYQAAKHE